MRLRRCSHSETFCVNGFLAWLLLLMTTPSDLAVFLVRESWRQKDVTWTSELAIEWTEVTSTHANSCHGTWTNLGHLTSPQWDLLAKLVMPHVEAIHFFFGTIQESKLDLGSFDLLQPPGIMFLIRSFWWCNWTNTHFNWCHCMLWMNLDQIHTASVRATCKTSCASCGSNPHLLWVIPGCNVRP